MGWKLHREKIITRSEVGTLLGLAKKNDRRDYLIFATGANAALRISEILHLLKSDIGPTSLRITRRKKKRLEAEDFPIPPTLGKLLLEGVGPRGRRDEWMFPGNADPCYRKGKKLCDGGHVSKREVQRRWSAYLGAAKLSMKGRGIHTLRHYAITEFYRTHKDLLAAQEYAGHSSPETTRVYAHVLDLEEKIGKVRPTL